MLASLLLSPPLLVSVVHISAVVLYVREVVVSVFACLIYFSLILIHITSVASSPIPVLVPH